MSDINKENTKKCNDCPSKTNPDICDEYCVHNDSVNAAENEMPPLDTLFSLAELFKMFGDSTRIRIMCALFGRELCVCDICELLNMGQSAVSHQLRLLRTASLVKVRREGKSAYYSLDDEHIYKIFKLGLEHIQEHETGGKNQ